MTEFVHLHGHTTYSLGDATTLVEDVVRRVKEQGMTACAITDHGTMAGIVDFMKECKRTSYKDEDENDVELPAIKPIIGMEAYIAWDRADLGNPKSLVNPTGHIILLAKNREGYANLCTLLEYGHTVGFSGKPRIDLEVLSRHSDGLIGLSACVGGLPQKCMLGWKHYDRKLKKRVKQDPQPWLLVPMVGKLMDIFGKDHFFLEVQNHRMDPKDYAKLGDGQKEQYDWLAAAQYEVVKQSFEASEMTECPLVVTNDFHYLDPDYAETRQAILAVGGRGLMNKRFIGRMADPAIKDAERDSHENTGQMYVKSPEEMKVACHGNDYPFLMKNTLAISDMIEHIDLSPPKDEKGRVIWSLPPIELGEHKSMIDMLRTKMLEGFEVRFRVDTTGKYPWMTQEHRDASLKQAHYELEVMENLGLESYHLVVADYVEFARRSGILVGPGRGSGAGSVVVYCLGITDLDPLRHGLLFERYLNPARATAADLDIDFDPERVDEIHQYCVDKYGAENVAKISTYGSIHARGGVKKVGRAMGLSRTWTTDISEKLPKDQGEFRTKLADIIKDRTSSARKILTRFVDEGGELAKDMLRIAAKLDNVKISRGQHAAGIVVSGAPLRGLVPLVLHNRDDPKSIATEIPWEFLEDLGLLKQDLLVVDGLTIIQRCLDSIHEHTPDFELTPEWEESYREQTALKIFGEGELGAVWQMSSHGMRELCMQLQPMDLNEIAAICALYRPGPLDYVDPDTRLNMVEMYVRRKHGLLPVEYDHPLLEDILKETYGVIVFQEQIMHLAVALCGYTKTDADYLRKAVAKKKGIAEQKEKFISGALGQGINTVIVHKIWNQIETFGKYGFNKAHSAAYGKLSYQMAYLKGRYPVEFLAAAITVACTKGDKERRVGLPHDFVDECNRRKIEVLPPCIVESRQATLPTAENCIRLGFGAVRGVAKAAAKVAETGIDEGHSLVEAIRKTFDTGVNRAVVKALGNVGAFDRYGERNSVMDVIHRVSEMRTKKSKVGKARLEEFFGLSDKLAINPEVENATEAEMKSAMYDYLYLCLETVPVPEPKRVWASIPPEESAGFLTNLRLTPKGDTELLVTMEDQDVQVLVELGKFDLQMVYEMLSVHRGKVLQVI